MAAAASTTTAAAAAPAKDSSAAGDLFAFLDKDALQPLSPESAKKHSAASIQIYASPAKPVDAPPSNPRPPTGEWKCVHCQWKNASGSAACYLCKAGADGTKKKDSKPSAFSEKIDINAVVASPTASSALDEMMGITAKK